MQLTFLQAAEPLTKSYEKLPTGDYRGSSYPNVYLVTSHVEDVETIEDFADAIRKHAELGNCLYTSSLIEPLVDAPRAKMAVENEKPEWLVMDLDGVEFRDTEDFIARVLPTAFRDVSYIEQHSPSSGIKTGVRLHLFFLLERGEDRKAISDWLKSINLATGPLRDQVTLSRKQMALSWPLDIVANNKARPIYITPPTCVGFSDPVTERVRVVKKKLDKLYCNFYDTSGGELRKMQRELIDKLRADAGLSVSRKEDIYDYRDDIEYLKKELTDPARVTEWQEDNDKFMRCNLDGGDSWAYFYYRDKGNWLHNFKGEPALHLPTLDPNFHATVVKPYADELREKANQPFVFRDEVSDKYYMGIRRSDEIIRQPYLVGSRDKIEDYFVIEGNTSPPANISTWIRDFDPTREGQWFPDEQRFNFWRPTEYMKNAMARVSPPETIEQIIRHVTGDEESYERFINWLAYIFQTRKKSGTAWVLHGVPGTGKGLLCNHVIRPIFGEDYCQVTQIRDLRSQFNGWLEHALFINVDETNAEDAGREESAVIEALKHWITEPQIRIEAKNQNARVARNFSNFIFTTNDYGSLPIQDGDRRFNVAARQERPIAVDADVLEKIRGELEHFAGFLHGYNVSEELATRSFESAAKAALREASRTSIDDFVHALMDGDLEYFLEATQEPSKEYESLENFKTHTATWLDDASNERTTAVSIRQLRDAYVVACSERQIKIGKFGKLMAKRGFPSKRFRHGNVRVQGWEVDWKVDASIIVDHKKHLKAVPTESELEEKIKNEISERSEG